jgi:hypothetical protein
MADQKARAFEYKFNWSLAFLDDKHRLFADHVKKTRSIGMDEKGWPRFRSRDSA